MYLGSVHIVWFLLMFYVGTLSDGFTFCVSSYISVIIWSA